MNRRIFYVGWLAFNLCGCAGPAKDAGFDDVRTEIEQRSGGEAVWRQETPEDAELDRRVEGLLREDLTTDAAVQIALLNNRKLQALYEDLGVARSLLVQAGLLKNPIFDAAVLFPLSGGATELDFSIAQDFLEIFFIPLRKKIAGAEFDAVRHRVAHDVLAMVGQVRRGFYRVQADQQLLEMRRQVLKATEASAELARRLHDAGNIRDLDLAREQSLHEQARLELIQAESQLVGSREELNTLLGLWGEQTQWKIAARLAEIPGREPEMADAEKTAIDRSLELAMMRSHLQAAGHRIGLARASGLIPVFEAGAMAEREEGRWEIGPSFEWPIPLFDHGQARTAAARSQMRKLQKQYYYKAVEIRSAVRSTRQRLLSTRQTVLQYRNVLLPLRQKMLDEMQLEYNAMQVGAFDLLLAKQIQIETGRRYIESLLDYWDAHTEMDLLQKGVHPEAEPHIGRSISSPTLTLEKAGH